MSTQTTDNDAETLKDRLNYLQDRRETMIAEEWPDHKIESITAEIEKTAEKLEKRNTTRLLPGFPGYSDRLEAQEGGQ